MVLMVKTELTGSNHPKTLTGIETDRVNYCILFGIRAPITPKPLQGLKRITEALALQTTDIRAPITPKPLQGLKHQSVRSAHPQARAPITPKPLQGLKLRLANLTVN